MEVAVTRRGSKLKGRAVPAFVGIYSLCLLFVPLFHGELVPFSSFSMYSTRPAFINTFELTRQNGSSISPLDFALHVELHPWGPRYGGIPVPETLNTTQEAMSFADSIELVERFLKQNNEVGEFKLKQTIAGRRPDGSFGVLDEKEFDLEVSQ